MEDSGKVNKCHPLGLFRDNLQHWLEDLSRLLKVQFTSNEGMVNDAPIHECERDIDHYTGHVLFTKTRRVPGGILPYTTYTGMCRPTGS